MLKKLILAAVLLLTTSVALADRNGTFSTANANVNGTGAEVELRGGKGSIVLDGDFGAGDILLQLKRLDGSWLTMKTYTALPDPNPEKIDLSGRGTVRVIQENATAPTLYWELRVAPK